MPLIAPSLLSANFLDLRQECEMLNSSLADWFHLDVMDGRFVPNISFGPMLVEFICSTTQKFCDVHLMIEEPEKYVSDFQKAGANNLTIHYEACTHLHRNIQLIKSSGMQAGIALNPHTLVQLVQDVLQDIDLVCIMSVNPGFGGQTFIPQTLHKIRELKTMISARSLNVKIEVDGGVTLANAPSIIDAGADVLVAGNTVFKAASPAEMIKSLKEL